MTDFTRAKDLHLRRKPSSVELVRLELEKLMDAYGADVLLEQLKEIGAGLRLKQLRDFMKSYE